MTLGERKDGLVVGVHDSVSSDAAVRWAANEASIRAFSITLLHVVAPTLADSTEGPIRGGVTQRQEDQARQILGRAQEVVDAVAGQHLPRVDAQVRYARVVPTLVEASKDVQLIVVGRGRGPHGRHRRPWGSVSSELVHHAHCPVAVVPASEAEEQQIGKDAPVVVGIDGSPASEAATAWAFEEASWRRAPLVALHAWSDVGVFPVLGMDWRKNRDEGRELLAERLAGWQEKFPDVPVRQRLVADVPARWLVEESKGAQLVVVGSHGRGVSAGIRVGSVSSAVVRSAQGPVVVVRTSER